MMQDEAGGDEKIIAVPVPKLTRRYENVHNYTDLPEITLDQIQHFFVHYKDLEPGKWVKVAGWGDGAGQAEQMAAWKRGQRKARLAGVATEAAIQLSTDDRVTDTLAWPGRGVKPGHDGVDQLRRRILTFYH